MGNVSYRPLLEDMVWSYSRIECYHDCPYRFFLKYIDKSPESPLFYSSYGLFMHRILEQYYKGELKKEDMKTKFLFGFQKEVQGERPKPSTVEKYISDGVSYLGGFQPFPCHTVAVEQRLPFNVNGIPFVCVIDYIGEENGELCIIDHKSRDMKPRSGRKKPTKTDEELDSMLRQLYLYSAAVKQHYGVLPKKLCFNTFRNDLLIEEPFSEKAYEQTLDWAKRSVEYIIEEDDYYPNIEFFGCLFLCGFREECCYWKERCRQ